VPRYVSIDAATKESLKAVDRPLFKDFWERFLACLAALKAKGQRTVYRLTLVKSWNMTEVDEYVKLLDIGEPQMFVDSTLGGRGLQRWSSQPRSSMTFKLQRGEVVKAFCVFQPDRREADGRCLRFLSAAVLLLSPFSFLLLQASRTSSRSKP